MKFRSIFALLATMPGSVLAHEVPGWKIENDRGDVLITTISTTSIAGDWCGIEPAKLSLRCDDDQLSLLIKSNCEPDTGPNQRSTITINFSGVPMQQIREFEVLEDRKTLRLTEPFQSQNPTEPLQSGRFFLSGLKITSYGMGNEPTITVSLPEANRPNRDMIFNVHKIIDAVKTAGMQCSALSLFD